MVTEAGIATTASLGVQPGETSSSTASPFAPSRPGTASRWTDAYGFGEELSGD